LLLLDKVGGSIFGPGTDSVLLLTLFLLFLGQHSPEKPKALLFQIGSWLNLTELFFK